MKKSLLALALGFHLLAFAEMAHAEDPLLGIVRGIKCLNCVADSVVLLVDDPIEQQEIEVTIPSRDYNKIMVPLQGKSLHTRDEGCFYWVEKLKNPSPLPANGPQGAATQANAAKPAKARKPGNSPESSVPGTPAPPAADSAQVTTKESACIPFHAKSRGVH